MSEAKRREEGEGGVGYGEDEFEIADVVGLGVDELFDHLLTQALLLQHRIHRLPAAWRAHQQRLRRGQTRHRRLRRQRRRRRRNAGRRSRR
jgi:hypothetical protein